MNRAGLEIVSLFCLQTWPRWYIVAMMTLAERNTDKLVNAAIARGFERTFGHTNDNGLQKESYRRQTTRGEVLLSIFRDFDGPAHVQLDYHAGEDFSLIPFNITGTNAELVNVEKFDFTLDTTLEFHHDSI